MSDTDLRLQKFRVQMDVGPFTMASRVDGDRVVYTVSADTHVQVDRLPDEHPLPDAVAVGGLVFFYGKRRALGAKEKKR